MKQTFHRKSGSLFLGALAVLLLGAVAFHASPTRAATHARRVL